MQLPFFFKFSELLADNLTKGPELIQIFSHSPSPLSFYPSVIIKVPRIAWSLSITFSGPRTYLILFAARITSSRGLKIKFLVIHFRVV